MKPVTVTEGRRTYWMNFSTYTMDQEKLKLFVQNELGTGACIQDDVLIIKGRYTTKAIKRIADKYSADPDVLLLHMFTIL